MLTRPGQTVAAGALAALVIGRVFGIIELFVIGAGLGLAVLAAVLVVRLRRAELSIVRWVHPSVLTVGDVGRVDLLIENRGATRSPRVELTEPVGRTNTAQLGVGALEPGEQVSAGYRVPAARRGVLQVGPATIERRDLLGIAVDVRVATDVTEITVAPQTFEMPMPALGHGILGRHLLAISQRLGPGEFHSLRDYLPGDEPRSIHWRASARAEELKVRQHEAQGVRRCIVVLDRDGDAYPSPVNDDAIDVFERAVTAAASVVLSADRAGLTTRFITGGGIDLRGPDVAPHTLRILAPIELGPPLGELERDAGEGLGLVVVVTSSPATDAWRRTNAISDPTLTRVGVFTAGGSHGRLAVDASSITEFRVGWHRLAGAHGLTRSAGEDEAAATTEQPAGDRSDWSATRTPADGGDE